MPTASPTPSLTAADEADREQRETAERDCEQAVGRFVYNRAERLMDATAGTPEGAELTYLAGVIADVEEYGADGTEGRAPRTLNATILAGLGPLIKADKVEWSPAPWTVSDIEQGPYVVCAEHYAIAQMVRMPGGFDTERLATAHLMAAAPDLYDALREFFTSGDFDIETTGNPAATAAWIAKARAALAKARG